jgi:hypothetical protein
VLPVTAVLTINGKDYTVTNKKVTFSGKNPPNEPEPETASTENETTPVSREGQECVLAKQYLVSFHWPAHLVGRR